MKTLKLLLAIDLVAFVIYSIYAVLELNDFGHLIAIIGSHAMATQIFLDLVISLTFVAVWLWFHAKSIGVNPLPYLLLIPFTGSIIVMVYVLRHVMNTDSGKLNRVNESQRRETTQFAN